MTLKKSLCKNRSPCRKKQLKLRKTPPPLSQETAETPQDPLSQGTLDYTMSQETRSLVDDYNKEVVSCALLYTYLFARTHLFAVLICNNPQVDGQFTCTIPDWIPEISQKAQDALRPGWFGTGKYEQICGTDVPCDITYFAIAYELQACAKQNAVSMAATLKVTDFAVLLALLCIKTQPLCIKTQWCVYQNHCYSSLKLVASSKQCPFFRTLLASMVFSSTLSSLFFVWTTLKPHLWTSHLSNKNPSCTDLQTTSAGSLTRGGGVMTNQNDSSRTRCS